MNIEILFEDDYLIIVSKPPCLLVHPCKMNKKDKENMLFRVRDHLGHYVFPVNRLDRAVSGIVIFAKNSYVARAMKDLWHTETTIKKYLALSRGIYKEAGVLDLPLTNEKKVKKDSLTLYKPLKLYPNATLLEVEIKTGRRHQIRRHFAKSVDHLLGDRLYGKKKYNDHFKENYQLNRLFLHSHFFQFIHPYTDELITINCALYPDLQIVLRLLEGELLENFSIPDYISLYEK